MLIVRYLAVPAEAHRCGTACTVRTPCIAAIQLAHEHIESLHNYDHYVRIALLGRVRVQAHLTCEPIFFTSCQRAARPQRTSYVANRCLLKDFRKLQAVLQVDATPPLPPRHLTQAAAVLNLPSGPKAAAGSSRRRYP